MNTQVCAVLLCFSLCSCVVTDPHENFKRSHEFDVGKRTDDPRTTFAGYKLYYTYRVLDDGNIEYKDASDPDCVTFKVVDPATQIIQSWRYIGTAKNCQQGG